ncbi:MAG TPA: site-specific integrase [Actinomycetales bacterium]|nr:site-specific integrase [Actinomycetales bacterium]
MADEKRRDRGTGSVHERPNGTWCGQIDLGTIDGKRRRRTIYGPTRKAVQTEMNKLRRQFDEHGDLPTSDPWLEDWLKTWLRTVAARRVKPNTLRSYKTGVNKHIIPAIGRTRLSKLGVEHLDRMHTHVIDELGLSPTTAFNAHRILSIALNDGMKRNKVSRNVAGLPGTAPTKAESDRTGLTAAEAIKVLTVAGQDMRLGSRWLAAFLLGARQGECLGLRWEHVDLVTGRVDLAWSLQRIPWEHRCGEETDDGWPCGKKQAARCPTRELTVPRGMAHRVLEDNLVLLRPKTKGSIRSVALYEPLRLALIARREQVKAERPGYTTDHDLVWCRQDGGPLDPKRDWQTWTDLLDAAGVQHVTGHETRHTTATLMLEEGVDRSVIMEILGHSTVVVTQGYQHVSLDLQRTAIGKVGRRLKVIEAEATASQDDPAGDGH